MPASVSSSALSIGIILDSFSLEGWSSKLTDVSRIFARIGDILSQECLRNCKGQEYRPCDLLFGIDRISNSSCEVTGLKKPRNLEI